MNLFTINWSKRLRGFNAVSSVFCQLRQTSHKSWFFVHPSWKWTKRAYLARPFIVFVAYNLQKRFVGSCSRCDGWPVRFGTFLRFVIYIIWGGVGWGRILTSSWPRPWYYVVNACSTNWDDRDDATWCYVDSTLGGVGRPSWWNMRWQRSIKDVVMKTSISHPTPPHPIYIYIYTKHKNVTKRTGHPSRRDLVRHQVGL